MDFEALYSRIAPRLTNYLMANSMDYAGACDIVQESFLRLWKMRDKLEDDDSQISGLVWTIARNLLKDKWRKDARLSFKEEITDSEIARSSDSQSAAHGGTQSSPSDREYLRKRLLAAFKELPPPLKEAYLMFQVMELPISEIARRTNASESNVKVRIFRAKEKLKVLLKDVIGEV